MQTENTMTPAYSGHSLVSDVTPWWWARYWDERQPEVKTALGMIATLRHVSIEEISVARDGLRLRLAVSDGDDTEKLKRAADEIRLFLDELVKPATVPAIN